MVFLRRLALITPAVGLGVAYTISLKPTISESAALKPVPGANLPTREVAITQEEECDVAIIGGGIIGLATAMEVLKRFPNKTVTVLEKEDVVGAHQTSHNSGVIHAGMYYKEGTNMAKCCVEGARRIYEYADLKKIPYDRVGKLIVATTEEEHEMVKLLKKRGDANGVKGLEILDSEVAT